MNIEQRTSNNEHRIMKSPIIWAGIAFLLIAVTAQAQFELKSGNFNNIFVAQDATGANATPSGPAVVTDPSPTDPDPTSNQFAAMGQVSGGTGPLSGTTVHVERYPSNPDGSLVLVHATIGGVFASGVPRYSLGDVITPPLAQVDGVTPGAPGYWRQQPVLPGEGFQGVNSGTALFPLGTVNVTEAATNSTLVTVATPLPPELVVGATLLGQPITGILGTTVTLAGNANSTIAGSTASPITPTNSYYYSPHAEKVFASQAGRVTITWVTRVADGGGNYFVRNEDFAVSSNTALPVRTIYWTEGSFDGPKVQVTDGRITTVNPVYNPAVPKAVAEEVSIPGYNPTAANLSTLSFEKFNGIGQIKAYNVEGRILVEYLGNVRLAGNIYEFVGLDVVDIKRVPTVNTGAVHLGSEIRPFTEAPAGEPAYVPSPVLANIQDASSFYGTTTRADGSLVYYAERETSVANDPDNGDPASVDAYNKVVFYWLQEGTFGIQWPQFQDRYWQRWSPWLDDYAHYTVEAGGSTPETGVAFSAGLLPEIIYQDDPAQAEAQIDLATQRLFVELANDARSNRALLKFTTSEDVWYVNVYTQTEDRAAATTRTDATSSTVVNTPTIVTVPSTAGLTAGMVVTGPGITGSATIVSIIDGTSFELSQIIPDATNVLTYQITAELSSASFTDLEPSIITVTSTAGLEVGMIVSGPDRTQTYQI